MRMRLLLVLASLVLVLGGDLMGRGGLLGWAIVSVGDLELMLMGYRLFGCGVLRMGLRSPFLFGLMRLLC